jgi:putative iron-regulated protein
VLENYRSLAELEFSDALAQAKALNTAIDAFLADPTEKTLASAKTAWFASRVPYQQTEVYRFGNAYVDDWEGKVNAWPLDEGLIDYVDASYGTESDENPYYSANIIANPKLTIGGKEVDATTIDKKLLAETLHEIDEVESNVATGYHVIEFLLWGQDLYGTNPGAGERPASDFSTTKCTGGNCDRRRDYLKAATDLLIDDLNDIVAAWAPEGDATKQLQAKGDQGGLSTILTGMGSLAYGELAGERIKLGLMLHDPEEEHDCFSDNTHYSHFYDAVGIKNVYTGSFTDSQGKTSSGASLSALIATMNADLDQEMKQKLDATEAAMQVMVDSAKAGSPVDVLIGEGNTKGNQIIQNVVDALVSQTKTTEKIVAALKLEGIEVEGSDSLDNPEAVFN